MTYTIYTFGGGEALWKVLNGLALFFQSEAGSFNSVMKLSMAVGALWATLRAIYGANVGIFARDYVIPTYLILNVLLLPTTTVHIVDEVNPGFKYSQVAHVPLGIAAVASTASQISKLLTNGIEQHFGMAEANHYGKTGPLFAARLISMAREMRVVDPVERQNLKDFVRQCFTLPYVWTNMKPGKKAALETPHLLGFIAQNPHTWLGSYWRSPEGEATFRYCQAGAARAQEVLRVESPNALTALATQLFGSTSPDSVQANLRLKAYFNDAWQALAQGTVSAHEVAAQEMMMNAYREGLDDKRQEFGLERLNPHLIASSSTRAKSQQNTGFLVSAQMVGSLLPSLQSTMLALLCILFVFVIPLTMLPGGLKTLSLWMKLILWVESWPIFYAVIQCVALMMASGQGSAYVATGGGLSLLTQNGLADAAYDAYCYAQGLMSVVPVLSWAVISGSGHALANIVTRNVECLSSKLGTEMVDGNLNFDNQSYHNRSIAGYQLAQQQLGSSFSYGEKYDDGRMSLTYDTEGRPIIHEAQTQLKSNVVGTENLSASLSENAQSSLNASHNESQMASQQLQQGINESASYAHQHGKGSGVTDTFGKTDSTGASEDWRKAVDVAEKISAQTGLSVDKVLRAGFKAGLSTGPIGKVFGIDAGVSTEGNLSASEREDMNKVKDTGLQHQLTDSLTRGFQHTFDHKGSLSDQHQKQAIESIQGSFNKAKSYQDQAQASLTESENFSKAASLAHSSSLSSTTNWNDQALRYVADKRFGGDIGQAAHWQSQNSAVYEKEAQAFMASKQQALIESFRSSHALNEDQIREKFDTVYSCRIQNKVSDSDINQVKQRAQGEGVGLGRQSNEQMVQQVSTLRGDTSQAFETQQKHLATERGQVQQDHHTRAVAFDERKEDGVIYSLGKKAVNEAPNFSGIGLIRKGIKSVQKSSDSKDSSHNSSSSPSMINSYVTNGKTLEDDIAQHRGHSKVAAQGRDIKQLKDSLEMAKEQPVTEEVIFASSQTVSK